MAIPSEVFLSHSNRDQRFVTRLADMIRLHGVAVWYSRIDILGGQQWHDEIGDALRRCDWFLLILSQESVQSMWVQRELHFALQQERFADRILPLMYELCDFERLSWVLPSLQQVDFRKGFESGCRDLLRIWDLAYEPPDAGTPEDSSP
jgi:hypothetical protein